LEKNVIVNYDQSEQLQEPSKWNILRKGMRAAQNDVTSQRVYRVPEKKTSK
jgi:hypothetical protein